MYAALMFALFFIDTNNYIFLSIGLLYTINAFLIKKFMSRAAAVVMTILSLPVGYIMYQANVVNIALNFMVFLFSTQMAIATFVFHKNITPMGSSNKSADQKILPSHILIAMMLLYIFLFFDFQSHLLYFDYDHQYSIFIILLLLTIAIFVAQLLKRYFLQDKYGIEYYSLTIISILIFTYSGLPKILHSQSKSEITLNAKVLKIREVRHTSKHGHSYHSSLIETSNERLNHQEIDDINENAFYYLKENDTLIIHGEISDYLFKTIDVEFPDRERNVYYQRMRGSKS